MWISTPGESFFYPIAQRKEETDVFTIQTSAFRFDTWSRALRETIQRSSFEMYCVSSRMRRRDNEHAGAGAGFDVVYCVRRM
ncbi:hypothetical protein EVAR_60713_1 [Eumeta japonica]|uniref:Uncharacterized protein n=1 Tax=Eumeta variegata TaxID=151549 RepID=A0A4C1ZC35_EUMVA|nr:hypothetical protein EVAR_60713_1 [Eumeta japonica]